MERLSFLVVRGENDCYMVHGLEWAVYDEDCDWDEITLRLRRLVESSFPRDERPFFLDFRFPDGKVVSLCA